MKASGLKIPFLVRVTIGSEFEIGGGVDELIFELELPALILRGWVIILEWDGFEVDSEGDI